MANPLKLATLYCSLIIFLAIILRYFKILRFIIRLDKLRIQLVILLLVFIFLYLHQLKLNKNIIYMSKFGDDNLTLYNYQQHKLGDDTILTLLSSIFLSNLLSMIVSFNLDKPSNYYKNLS